MAERREGADWAGGRAGWSVRSFLWRGGYSRASFSVGSGLGLPIVGAIARAHGGDVSNQYQRRTRAAAELMKKDAPAVRHRHGMVSESLSEYGLTVRLRSNYGVYVTVSGRDGIEGF